MKVSVVIMVAIAVVVGLVLLVEVGLRLLFGFGNPLIYIADPEMGYLLAPNQNVRRFGNRIAINQYSMRSPDVSPTRPESTWRIFLLGDSVANGGWWTDQQDTISELLRGWLTPVAIAAGYQQVELLNASANSWGPRNELAYLKQFGAFESNVVVLIINTDDLFATAPTSLQVGRDRNYPDRKPPFAMAEVVGRYLMKQGPIPGLSEVQSEKGDRVGVNLEAIQAIRDLVMQANGQLLLAMTPLLREIGEPGPRDYEIKARQRLAVFTEQQHIPYIDFLPIFNATETPSDLYRDHIHLSPGGNQLVSQTLTDKLRVELKPQ